ncbi:MAG: hypothetical protein H3C31_02155 [Brumimicrobium sp.]|nr:hypothetical protein [Brumimicrobium sp.]
MIIDSIYTISGSNLEKKIVSMSNEREITIHSTTYRNEDENNLLQGIVLFHNNYEILREDEELINSLNKHNIPSHKVDLNGTLLATSANLERWLENNRPKSILLLGDKKVIDHEYLTNFLDKILSSVRVLTY